MEQRTDDYAQLARQLVELEDRSISLYKQQVDLLAAQTRRLDLISLTLASEKGFPMRQASVGEG